MKRALVMLIAGAGLACGGGGGGGGGNYRDPNSASFQFPAGTAPAVGSQEASAAQGAQTAMGTLLALPTASDASLQEGIGDVVNGPMELGSLLDGGIVDGSMSGAALRSPLSQRAVAYLIGGDRAALGFDDGCVTVGQDTVQFSNCTEERTDAQTGLTSSQTVNGAFHRAAGRVYWDATVAMNVSGTTQGGAFSLSFTYHVSGDIGFGDGAIQGYERADLAFSATSGSQSAAAKLTYNVDIDLHYLTGPFCISSGTLTVKLLWTEKPHGSAVDQAEVANLTDQAVQFTWAAPSPTSCWNTVTVARGTPQ